MSAITDAAAATVTAVESFGTELLSELEAKANSNSLGSAATKNITTSASAPTGGNNGDVWLQTGS